jgi:hypothetical protein
MLDYGVIAPRLQGLYEWSAEELKQPGLRGLIREGIPAHAWPFAERHIWSSPHLSLPVRALRLATAAP